jgi:tetratricopeptide (TPR) repeat protein
MNAPKRNRARVLTPDGLKKLREQMRSHEMEENSGYKYTLERLGELTELDPETVKNVLDCKGSDKRTIARCFESFGLTLEDSDHIPATQSTAAIADPNFVGRDEAIADLKALVSRNARVIVIQARGGVGKTTLARKYLQQEFGSFLEFPIAKETKDIASIEGLIEEKLRQLGEEPGREFLVSLDRLKRKLQADRIGILIDNLEPALDSAGKFIEAHRRYVELLRVLSDPIVKSITLITSRERLREADVTVQHYPLRNLDMQAWEQFFQSRSINTETPALAALHNAYGGNAKAMDIISGVVLEDFSGDVGAYWQANQDDLFVEQDLEDLVTKQFDRLQQLNPDAYKLLCRMGCYRYQDVPTIPIEGLFCLLWDVPENRHRRVIKSLQDRSLIDFEDWEYWLHPVIRAEAISRLRIGDDWEKTNTNAAEFWTNDVKKIKTFKNALRAFEAYHHFWEIRNIEEACNVFLERRPNSWEHKLTLGSSMYRMGLFQQIILEIPKIIQYRDELFDLSSLNRLYHYLANANFAVGNIKSAIEFQERANDVLSACAELMSQREDFISYFKDKQILSLFSIGVYKVDLWELEEAAILFEKVKCSSQDISSSRWAAKALSFLGFTRICLGFTQEANVLADEAYEIIMHDKSFEIEWFAYYLHILGKTYKLLGDSPKSLKIYKQALLGTDDGNIQTRAKIINGMAEIERVEKRYEKAISQHLEAIELLTEVGVKCDLAECHFQLGLTYQEMGEIEKGISGFQEAIRLFSSMEAPKQVERVRQSMQSS